MTVRLALLAALVAILPGCGDHSVVRACTADYVFGLSISVTDAAPAAPVGGVAAEIRDGSWVDPQLAVVGNTVMGAGERPGVYAITIRKSGYADWTKGGVTVRMTSDGCHVQGVHLDAALVPRS